MLDYNEITEKRYIVFEGQPYEVLDAHVFRKQQRKPVNQTKLRNLITGSIKQQTFHVQDSVAEADIEKSKVIYSFKKESKQTDGVEYWFYNADDKSARFFLNAEFIGNQVKYLKEGNTIDALRFNDQVIGIRVPIKVELKVTDAPPAVRGNSATGANKMITLETGAQVNAPLFINAGETVIVNTETGEYVGRASSN